MLPISNSNPFADPLPNYHSPTPSRPARFASEQDRQTRIYTEDIPCCVEEVSPVDLRLRPVRRASLWYCEGRHHPHAPSPPPASAQTYTRKSRRYGTLYEMADVLEKGGYARDMEKSPPPYRPSLEETTAKLRRRDSGIFPWLKQSSSFLDEHFKGWVMFFALAIGIFRGGVAIINLILQSMDD